MELIIGEKTYKVVIKRKKIKHTYIRYRAPGFIQINTSYITTNKELETLLKTETNNIIKMIKGIQKRKQHKNYLLGKPLNIVYGTHLKQTELCQDNLLLKSKKDLDIFYRDFALKTYKERLALIYPQIEESIPWPTIKVRKMKTRWGVCNVETKTITLNLDLIKYNYQYIDYVLVHELCHFIHFNHAPQFWQMVSKYIPNYKECRQELRN